MKEKVLTALKTLGFMPEEVEDFGYRFEYEGLTLAFPVNEEDDKCLTLMMPDIFDISDDNRIDVLEAMAKLCGNVKYVQPQIISGNQVWLNYQHYLDENGVTPDLVEHMIRVLDYATQSFHRIINGDDNDD